MNFENILDSVTALIDKGVALIENKIFWIVGFGLLALFMIYKMFGG